ncbi:Crp/Fnr family transcriptional regulator [Micromonospora sp. WMMD730]|uniref:Crp/Fnr family transcriptional regulator n=1 Tax=Micromonospora sp. WMMD730 TaxID=3404128 RepID=UPI003B940876
MDTWPAGTLLAALTDTDRAALLRLGTGRPLGRGQTIIREGSTGEDVFVITAGSTKVFGDTYDGRTALLALRVAGDIVGELAALDAGRRSATVVTCTVSTVRVIGRTAFDDFLRDRPDAARAVQKSVVAKLRQATRLRIDAGGSSAVVRLARLLAYLASRYGRDVPDGRAIDVPLSQTDLAAMAGISEPSVQRALGELRRRGLIASAYREIVVRDDAGLQMFSLGEAG